jgi:predicted transcriptional regulator
MTHPLDPAVLVRAARKWGGLSQRTMAEKASTSQSVVARIETGVTDPSGETLRRLLAAAGLEARCELAPIPVPDTHMLQDVERILALSPEERLEEVMNFNRFISRTQRVESARSAEGLSDV